MDNNDVAPGNQADAGATPSGALSRRAFAAGTLSLAALAAGTAPAYAETDFRAASGPHGPHRGEQPNILIIMADDLGWGDLSCYGAPHIKTPNLDRLARQGVRSTQGYAGSSTCSPTRISLYTGRYPGRLEAGLSEPIAAINDREGLPPSDTEREVIRERLWNLDADQREEANLINKFPQVAADLKGSWERTAATLLPYPAGQVRYPHP